MAMLGTGVPKRIISKPYLAASSAASAKQPSLSTTIRRRKPGDGSGMVSAA
jgi:hypothetical protein